MGSNSIELEKGKINFVLEIKLEEILHDDQARTAQQVLWSMPHAVHSSRRTAL